MKTKHSLSLAVILLCLSLTSSFGIEGLKLSLQCTSVVLRWPSIEGETYIVQYRATLDTNDTWQTLTNFYPAFTETNSTTFVHSNQFATCVSSGSSSGGASGSPLAPSFASTSTSGSPSTDSTPKAKEKTEKKKELPPMPWDQSTWPKDKTKSASGGIQAAGASGGEEAPQTGFYRVVRNGVSIAATNLTNIVLSGSVPVSFEAENPEGVISSASLLIDGLKFPGAEVLSAPTNYPWRFQMDTAFLENGEHAVQVLVVWYHPGAADQNRVYPSTISYPVYITVTNQIYYPAWEPEVGEGTNIAAFFLKTTDLNATWRIDIKNTNNVVIQTLTGQATNGLIEVYWNLTDTNSVIHTNAATDPFFNSVTTINPGQSNALAAPNPPKKQRKNDWPDHGEWTVAYQDFFKSYYSQNDAVKGSINFFVNIANQYGGAAYEPPGGTNGQTYPIRYQDTNHVDTNITTAEINKDLNLLIGFLAETNSRNFYYSGHSSGGSIAEIPSSELKKFVKHRYRFVFLEDILKLVES